MVRSSPRLQPTGAYEISDIPDSIAAGGGVLPVESGGPAIDADPQEAGADVYSRRLQVPAHFHPRRTQVTLQPSVAQLSQQPSIQLRKRVSAIEELYASRALLRGTRSAIVATRIGVCDSVHHITFIAKLLSSSTIRSSTEGTAGKQQQVPGNRDPRSDWIDGLWIL